MDKLKIEPNNNDFKNKVQMKIKTTKRNVV